MLSKNFIRFRKCAVHFKRIFPAKLRSFRVQMPRYNKGVIGRRAKTHKSQTVQQSVVNSTESKDLQECKQLKLGRRPDKPGAASDLPSRSTPITKSQHKHSPDERNAQRREARLRDKVAGLKLTVDQAKRCIELLNHTHAQLLERLAKEIEAKAKTQADLDKAVAELESRAPPLETNTMRLLTVALASNSNVPARQVGSVIEQCMRVAFSEGVVDSPSRWSIDRFIKGFGLSLLQQQIFDQATHQPPAHGHTLAFDSTSHKRQPMAVARLVTRAHTIALPVRPIPNETARTLKNYIVQTLERAQTDGQIGIGKLSSRPSSLPLLLTVTQTLSDAAPVTGAVTRLLGEAKRQLIDKLDEEGKLTLGNKEQLRRLLGPLTKQQDEDLGRLLHFHCHMHHASGGMEGFAEGLKELRKSLDPAPTSPDLLKVAREFTKGLRVAEGYAHGEGLNFKVNPLQQQTKLICARLTGLVQSERREVPVGPPGSIRRHAHGGLFRQHAASAAVL